MFYNNIVFCNTRYKSRFLFSKDCL